MDSDTKKNSARVAIAKALTLLRSVHVLEGTDKDQVEDLLTAAGEALASDNRDVR